MLIRNLLQLELFPVKDSYVAYLRRDPSAIKRNPQLPSYPTQKNLKMLELIIKQSSNKDSIIMDCFAGSGTTLLAAAKYGRNFIGIDSSKIAINVIKKRLSENDISYVEMI